MELNVVKLIHFHNLWSVLLYKMCNRQKQKKPKNNKRQLNVNQIFPPILKICCVGSDKWPLQA